MSELLRRLHGRARRYRWRDAVEVAVDVGAVLFLFWLVCAAVFGAGLWWSDRTSDWPDPSDVHFTQRLFAHDDSVDAGRAA